MKSKPICNHLWLCQSSLRKNNINQEYFTLIGLSKRQKVCHIVNFHVHIFKFKLSANNNNLRELKWKCNVEILFQLFRLLFFTSLYYVLVFWLGSSDDYECYNHKIILIHTISKNAVITKPEYYLQKNEHYNNLHKHSKVIGPNLN